VRKLWGCRILNGVHEDDKEGGRRWTDLGLGCTERFRPSCPLQDLPQVIANGI